MPRRPLTPALRLGLLAVLGLAGGAAAFGMFGGGGGRAADSPGARGGGEEMLGAAASDRASAPAVLASGGRGVPGKRPADGGDVSSSPSRADARASAGSPHAAPPGPKGVKADDAVELTIRTILAQQADDGRIPADPALRPCARGEVAFAFRPFADASGDARASRSPAPSAVTAAFDPQDVLLTAYAVEALMADGYTPRSDGPPGRFLAKAFTWLKGRQSAQGGFGTRDAPTSALADAHATAAFVRLYGLMGGAALRPVAARALDALGSRFDRSRSDALPEDDPTFPETAMAAAQACGDAAHISAADRTAGKAETVAPPLGLVQALAAWAAEPVPEGTDAELPRAMVRVSLGADPKFDASLLRIVARLRNAPGEPGVPADLLARYAAAVLMRAATYEDWCVWHRPFWTKESAGDLWPVSKDPCDARTRDGSTPTLRTLTLDALARDAFQWTHHGDPPPVDAMDEARRALPSRGDR